MADATTVLACRECSARISSAIVKREASVRVCETGCLKACGSSPACLVKTANDRVWIGDLEKRKHRDLLFAWLLDGADRSRLPNKLEKRQFTPSRKSENRAADATLSR